MRSITTNSLRRSLLLLIVFLAYSSIDAQSILTGVNGSNDYDINFTDPHITSDHIAIYDFQDGTFARHFTSNFTHNYQYPGSYSVTVNSVEKYRPGTLKRVVLNPNTGQDTVTTTGPSNQGPLTVVTSGDLHISRAWENAVGHENYYVLTITNLDFPGQLTEGTVEFALPPDLMVEPGIGHLGCYNGDCELDSYTNHSVELSFSGLDYMEQRNIFIPVMTNPSAPLNLTASVNAVLDYIPIGSSLTENLTNVSQQFTYAANAHDPNKIYGSPECIRRLYPESQTLTYRVEFLNEGNAPATVVTANIALPTHLDPTTIQMMDASVESYNWSETGGIFTVVFDSIMLPGLAQPQSEGVIDYSQCTGYFEFSICAYPNISPGEIIEMEAEIIFDNQPSIWTFPPDITAVDECFLYTPQSCYSSMISSNIELGEEEIMINPNPASDFIEILGIKALNLDGGIIEIFNARGQLSLRQNIQNTMKVNVSELPSGLYLCRIKSGDNQYTGDFIKI